MKDYYRKPECLVAKDKAGNLYFGGIDGFTKSNPENLGKRLNLTLDFETIETHNNAQFSKQSRVNFLHAQEEIATQKMSLEKSSTTKKHTLNYTENHLKITLRALQTNMATAKCQLYYKLTPDEEWQLSNSTDNSVQFANLPSGQYQLTFQLRESRGLAVSNSIQLPFVVKQPPFYQREGTQWGLFV